MDGGDKKKKKKKKKKKLKRKREETTVETREGDCQSNQEPHAHACKPPGPFPNKCHACATHRWRSSC